MENLRTLTIKQLQAKCREIGVSCSGNKNQLIDRIDNHNAKDARIASRSYSPDLAERVLQLEELIANMQPLINRYKPTDFHTSVEPPIMRTFITPENSPPDSTGVILHGMPSTRSQPTTSTITSVQQQYPLTSIDTAARSIYTHQYATAGNRCPVLTTENVTSHYKAPRVPSSTYVNNAPFTTHYGQQVTPPMINQNINPPISYGQHTIPPTTYGQQPPVLPNNVYAMPPPFSPLQNIVQPYPNAANPYGQVKEIISLVPDFNPSANESVNSSQFVRRVEVLKAAYGWDDPSVIFAVQQKMKGPAKYWVDSLQEVFLSWSEFTNKFLSDFPHTENEADIHIKMSTMTRRPNESPQEYYYRMYAFGKKGNLTESAIARHIVIGINDNDLKRKISNEYLTCNQLLNDINCNCNYNEIKTTATFNSKPKKNTYDNIIANTGVMKKESNTPLSKIKCYNCSSYGHYSVKCPEPQKKERRGKYNRT